MELTPLLFEMKELETRMLKNMRDWTPDPDDGIRTAVQLIFMGGANMAWKLSVAVYSTIVIHRCLMLELT